MYDEFISFYDELIELLEEDWIKCKTFIQKNKKYCMWVLILFITMQFTDIINLGTSYDRYCKIHNINNINNINMTGGAGEAPAPAPAPEPAAGGKGGKAGRLKNDPVMGNLGKMFNMVSGMFVIVTFILIVIGVLSLPVIIFIAITYSILKFILSKLSIL